MKVLLFFVVIAFIIGGGQGAYTMLTSSKLQSYTVEEYLEKSPDDKWLELTGCTLDHSDAVWMESRIGDNVKEAYIPIFDPKDEDKKSKIKILLATKNPETLDLVRQLSELKSEEEAMKFMVANMDKVLAERDVQGLVRFGIELDDDDAREIKKISPNLAEDFIILDEGKKPEWHSVILLPLGLFLGYFLYFRSKKEPAMAHTGPAMGGTPPPAIPNPQPPAAVTFNCPSCDQKFSVGPEMSGQQVACTNCQSAIQVP